MKTILNLLTGVTAAAALLLLFKRVLFGRLSAKAQYYLWLILAVRMVIPALPASPVSMMRLLPSIQETHETVRQAPSGIGGCGEKQGVFSTTEYGEHPLDYLACGCRNRIQRVFNRVCRLFPPRQAPACLK